MLLYYAILLTGMFLIHNFLQVFLKLGLDFIHDQGQEELVCFYLHDRKPGRGVGPGKAPYRVHPAERRKFINSRCFRAAINALLQ